MNGEFAGQVVVVTGAARGIGRAIAEELHACSAQLVLVDCNAAQLADVSSALAGAQRQVVDLANASSIAALAEAIARDMGRVDVLVNNAGIELDLPFSQITAEAFDRVIAVNLRAPLLLTKALLPLFPATGGAVVNISSVHADHAFDNSIPYACSKAGLVAQTRNLALELGPRHIRVNAVCPGYIDTPMWDQWLRTVDDPAKVARQTTALHPLGRRGLPQDVARAVTYLAGSGSAWVTGTCLVVDGGLTVRTHP